MISNTIAVDYDPKTRRLKMTAPFHLNDAIRGFPSKRFDPKNKHWKVPITKANLAHFETILHQYSIKMSPEADDAIRSFHESSVAPIPQLFPDHLYDFTKSRSGFLPMDHQRKMLDLAWGLMAAAWFAKMGTGKTYAAVHLACARYLLGQIDAVMIICPSTLRRTWLKELAKYATVDYNFQIHETKGSWQKAFDVDQTRDEKRLPILAVSVEGLGVSEALYDSACGFMPGRRVMVICDESSRIKNPDAKRTARACLLGSAAVYRLILNGTPIALGIQDLWSQYEFLDSNIIGTGDYWAFRTRYIVMGGYENKQIVGVQNVEELMNLIIPYTCEVGKDVLNLPPKVLVERPIELTKEQRKLMKIIVKGTSGDPNEPLIKVTNTLEKMLRCRQVVGGWLPRSSVEIRQIDGIDTEVWTTVLEPLAENPKMDGLFELIGDNFAGTKFIIWSTFVSEIEAIRDKLADRYGPASVECYYGKTEMGDRSRIEDRYCNDPTMRFFVGNPVAAGLGLTLISGENDVMVYYSGTNAYIERAQSEDRSHRIGQSFSVTVVDLVAENSVDEIIMASIREKMGVEEYVMTKIAQGVSVDDLLLGTGQR